MKFIKEEFTDKTKALKRAQKLAGKIDYQSSNVIQFQDKFIVFAPADDYSAMFNKEIKRYFIS